MTQLHPDTALLTLIGDLQTERLLLREQVQQQQAIISGLKTQLASLPPAETPPVRETEEA